MKEMSGRAKEFYDLIVADDQFDGVDIFEEGLAAALAPYAELLANIEEKLSANEVLGLLTYGIALRQVAFRELVSGIEATEAIAAIRTFGSKS